MDFFLKSLAGLFAIANPLGALPLFLALAPTDTVAAMRRAAITASITAAIAVLVFYLVGAHLLEFFGISLPAFQVSGGILIFLMALKMLEGSTSTHKVGPKDVEAAQDSEPDITAIVPIGVPLIAGPGTISTTILLRGEAEGLGQNLALLAAIAIVLVSVAAALLFADRIHRLIGDMGLRIATRVMGLILAAIAVQFVVNGVLDLLPGLAKA